MSNTNDVTINYDAVLDICDNMITTIKKINDEFEKVNNLINKTDKIWEGDASARYFWGLKKKYAGYVTFAKFKLPSYIGLAKGIVENNKKADTQINATSIIRLNTLLPSVKAIQADIYEKISYRINEKNATMNKKIKSTTTKTDSSSKSTTTTKTNNTVKNNTTTTSKTNSSAKNTTTTKNNTTTTSKTNSSAKSTSTTKNINVNKSHSDNVTTNDFTYEQTMKNSKFTTNDLKTNQTNTSSMEIKSLEEMINELNNK